MKLYSAPATPPTQAAQIVAAYAKAPLTVASPGDYHGGGPKAFPVLETAEGSIFGSSAVIKFIAALRPGKRCAESLLRSSP
jgi:hypothetical protein